MAIVMPLLIMLLLGIIEFANIMFVRHNLINAATQGARLGILPNATQASMLQGTQTVLNNAGISYPSLVINPLIALPPSTMVSVQVSVPLNEVAIFGSYFIDPTRIMGSTCTMFR